MKNVLAIAPYKATQKHANTWETHSEGPRNGHSLYILTHMTQLDQLLAIWYFSMEEVVVKLVLVDNHAQPLKYGLLLAFKKWIREKGVRQDPF